MNFVLAHTHGGARAGVLTTAHGEIPTPIFMPVGTQGAVKAMEHRELRDAGARVVLGNTYHLFLRPGIGILEKAGGLHRFMAWNLPILTDSGGYQVFSLAELRGISEDGVRFKSHVDGSSHMFTPESVVDIQRSLGSDIMMVLDECTPYPCDEEYADRSNRLTLRWAGRSQERAAVQQAQYGFPQALFAIVQGSTYPRIREKSTLTLSGMDFEGYAIGGLSVGEPAETMYAITELCTAILPARKPRYLMGVGTPENIVESIARGIDMFDCVLPTRAGRNALFFTRRGRVNIRNAKHADDFTPVDPSCSCYGCTTFTRAYIRHLFRSREILGLQLATMHNVTFFLQLVQEARTAILENRFTDWKATVLAGLGSAAAEAV